MTSSTTVLVVDDNTESSALVAHGLRGHGYNVVLARGGEAGIAAFERERPDCVLLDVAMPGVDGPTACRRIRALPGGAAVPIVFVTASRDVETFDRTVQAGGDDFMTKPFSYIDLTSRIGAALNLGRLNAERAELYAQVKQQRDDLQRLQLQKEQLIAFVVHDLKNPVNSIDLQVELLLRDREANERVTRAAEHIREESRSLTRMITTLLDVARADEGRLQPSREALDLGAMIATICASLEPRAQLAGVTLVPEIATPTLDADRDLMRRVLENLIENAVRHAPNGSAIDITARPLDRGIEIRVRDAGRGVPVGQRDRVFERFVQGEELARGGQGLGLAFCKLVIEAHGGRIWIEDANPGAAFCLWLEQPTEQLPS